MDLKKLTVNGEDFFYQVETFDCGPYGAADCYATHFYKYGGVKEVKKYLFFGPMIKKDIWDMVFTIQENIECPDFTKKEIRKMIEKKVELLKREEEIERGEII